MSPFIVVFAVFVYIILLFCLACLGEKQYFKKQGWVRHPIIYSLALGVSCTSWAFYGLVGTASEKGLNFLPPLLGTIILFTLGYPLLVRIYNVVRQEHAHSIADFTASRYGKRQGVAATVSIVVLVSTVPYIALQLKAVSDTFLLTTSGDFLASQDLTLIISLSMIVFALLFGAKRLDMSGYHSGLMATIAFEALVKFSVMLLVALCAIAWLFDFSIVVEQPYEKIPASDYLAIFDTPIVWSRFLVELVLTMCAILCLPRMFHVAFVECLSIKHLQVSRWVYSTYLAVTILCIAVIAVVASVLLHGENISGDAYMIELPAQQGAPWLTLLVFIGGFSAATAMIIVSTVTLSQMLSNDVILPLLIRRKKYNKTSHYYMDHLIFYRRLTVFLVVMSAYFYQSLLADNAALTSVGLTAFALISQLSPGILFGLYWRKGNARGLYTGLAVGLLLWFYTLMIPLLSDAGLIARSVVDDGFFGIYWLRPDSLLGLTFFDSFTRSVILSLGANIGFYCWYSITSSDTLADKIQAAAFTGQKKGERDDYAYINLPDLRILLTEFLGEASVEALFSKFYNADLKRSSRDKRKLVEESQQSLAAIVGIASSQSMIESLCSGERMAVEEMVNIVGETTKALRFNQEVLSASFENISSGVSVVDKNLRLIAWNHVYEKMFQYPENALYVGFHIADMMRFNAERGILINDGNVEQLIRRRLSYVASGKPHRMVRFHKDGSVIEVKGRPLPNGGYVTAYNDISEFIHVQKKLEDANTHLEIRVYERTKTIEKVNADLLQEIKQRVDVENELRKAKKIADEANASKTKFLALASHDIMQPLNAASLYASTLLEDGEGQGDNANVVRQLKAAIENTESIIATLLEVSKLDSGAIKPKLSDFDLDSMLCSLVAEANIQLPEGLSIRYSKTSVVVHSDRHYIYRIVQNFISNAVKYTYKGKVLIGCRRLVNHQGNPCVEVCVIDNGPGIPGHEKSAIFEDFYRVSSSLVNRDGIPGVGLGLAVVARFGELLQHPIHCRSIVGKGSCFSVVVPLAVSQQLQDNALKHLPASIHQSGLQGLRVLYVDDEKHNLLAISALLTRWQCEVHTVGTIAAAHDYMRQGEIPDVLLMDYQLDQSNITGLHLAGELVDAWKQRLAPTGENKEVPVCIVSAATEARLSEKVNKAGFQFLSKPIKPGRLRALLTQFKQVYVIGKV